MPKVNCGVPVGYIAERLAATSTQPATSSPSPPIDSAGPRNSQRRHDAGSTSSATSIDDHHRMDSTRRMFDQFNDLEGDAHDAGRLCHALDQWKHWADGRNVSDTVLVEVAATLGDHDGRPGISQLAAPLSQWAQRRGLELQPPTPLTPTRPSMGIEIDF